MLQYRTVEIDKGQFDPSKPDIVRVSFASEKAVLRHDADGKASFYEILSCDPADADLSLLNSQGLCLLDHDERRPAGEIVKGSAVADPDRRCRVTTKVTSPAVLQSVSISNPPPVSVGYTLERMIDEVIPPHGGIPRRTFKWKPYEVSFLLKNPPADPTVGAWRSRSQKPMTNDLDTIMKLALAGSRRSADDDLAGKTLTRAEARSYSLASVIAAGADRREYPRFELGIAGRVRDPMLPGLCLPWEIFDTQRRDMTTGSFAAGGAFVATDLAEEIAPSFLNQTCVVRFGARVLTGLRGNLLLPRADTAITPQTLPEVGLSQSQDVIGDQLALKPRRISATLTFSRQLDIQAGPAWERYWRQLLADVIAVKLDRLAIAGQIDGNPDQAPGILATPGVQNVTFGGQATFATIQNMEAKLDLTNARGNRAYLVGANTKSRWKQIGAALTGATTVGSRALWEDADYNDGTDDGRVNGYRAGDSLNVSGEQAILGSWHNLVIGLWGAGPGIIIDPYTLAASGKVQATIILFADVGIVRPQAFVVSTDAGNQ